MKRYELRALGLLFAFVCSTLVGHVAAAEMNQDNLVIVLDASGSMGDRIEHGGPKKMDAAKQALKEVLKNTPETVNIGLLVFPGNKWVFPLGPRDDAKLEKAIDGISAGGGTPLGENLKIGADELLKRRTEQLGYGTYRLLVITDGQASDQGLVDQYTPDVIGRGIRMDVIGVAMAQDHILATRAHSYRRANDPASLTSAIRAVVAEVSATNRNDSVDGSLFDAIQGIPDGAVPQIIAAFASSGNQPIGEQPASPGQTAPGQTQPDNAQASGKILLIILGIVVAIVVIGFIVIRLDR